MKKKVFVVFLILFGMFFNIFDVNAEENSLIYHVNYFNINTSSKKIYVEGFAFIDHMDNYGGSNLATSIVASGGGKTISFDVEYLSEPGNYNYYYARCMNSSNSGADDYCSSSHAQAVAGSIRGDHDICNNRGPGSDCAYFNVNFKVEIDLEEIYQKVGDGNEVSFKINSTVDGVSRSSDFGVNYNNCYVDGSAGMCGNDGGAVDIGLGSGTLKVSGVTNKVRSTVTEGLARYTNFMMLGSGIYYAEQNTFTTTGYYKGGVFNKINSGASFVSNYYIISGSRSGNTVFPGSGTRYVIFDSWVQVAYGLKITFNDVGTPTRVTEYSCLSGYDTKTSSTMNATCDGSDHKIKSCKKENISSFSVYYKLTDDEYNKANEGITDPSKYCVKSRYVKVSISTSVPLRSGGTTSLGVLIHQNGVFNFGTTSNSVLAGRGFVFPTLNYTNTFFGIYNTDVAKLYEDGFEATWSTSKKHVNYKTDPDTGDYVRNSNGDLIEESYEYKCDGTAGTHSFGFEDSNRIYESDSGAENISVSKLLQKKSTEIMNDNVNKNNVDSYKTIKPSSYGSNGEFDSNLVEVDGKYEESGKGYNASSFYVYNITGIEPETVKSTTDSSVNSSYKYVSTFKYNISDPYIQLTENGQGNMSDVFYGKIPSDGGDYEALDENNYYVSLLFPQDEDFLVRLNNSYLSFIKNMSWYLNGRCDIDVINKVYNCSGNSCEPKYRYRPIDLNDPFPNGKVPVNWKNWIKVSTNLVRLSNTYKKGFVYSITLINGSNSDGKKLAVNDKHVLNDVNYNSWKNIKLDGTSAFVNNSYYSFGAMKSDSYCYIGKFSDSCDNH